MPSPAAGAPEAASGIPEQSAAGPSELRSAIECAAYRFERRADETDLIQRLFGVWAGNVDSQVERGRAGVDDDRNQLLSDCLLFTMHDHLIGRHPRAAVVDGHRGSHEIVALTLQLHRRICSDPYTAPDDRLDTSLADGARRAHGTHRTSPRADRLTTPTMVGVVTA